MAPAVSDLTARVMRGAFTLLCCVAICYSLEVSSEEDEERKKRPSSALLATAKETSIANFVRLVAMRLVFSLAYQVGLGEWASGLFNGALVPPGSDYDDYGDYKDEGGDDYDDDEDYGAAFDFK
ncbi:uncharacterized protein LOC132203612 [Neocloeon triangulifer]|uniref:uncharacterized protein LOC132203612 n=1 Tax=Neocloeon triangulifer TaxID=2078957 RepID=UPI00286ED920|nr:uncharacterized protein LOC132203612 [Neocloeon triangulifer]XP_059487481.1 uncharacterized protein LOC132203612 [Neocloeon triangulifer]